VRRNRLGKEEAMSIYKAKTQLLVTNDYVVVDTETTGLDARWGEIIELGAIKVSSGEVTDSFSTLVKPQFLPLDEFITELTGITTEMVMEAPPLANVLPDFIDFIGDSPIVGHNVLFDAKFISAAVGEEIGNVLVDTMRISKHVNQSLRSHRLGFVYELCVDEGATPADEGAFHRAMHDAACTQIAYEHMKPKLVELYGEDAEKGWEACQRERVRAQMPNRNEVVPTVEEIDESNPFFGMRVCFTGEMESMTRAVAWQKLVNLGGIIESGVTQKLDYLVVGNAGFRANVEGDKSSKMKKAEANRLRGLPVETISEDFFLEFAKDV